MKEQNNRYREEERDEKNEKEEKEEKLAQEKQDTKVKVTKKTKQTETKEAPEEENELTKVKNTYLRLCADYDNFRKRSVEERSHYLKYASQSLLEKLINVTDLFDKAVSVETTDEKLKNYLIGFKMINESFKQILAEEGVKKIEALGKPFDANIHHAVEIEYDPEKAENIILKEMQSGYLYKDRMLRPSLVIVNKKEEREEENE